MRIPKLRHHRPSGRAVVTLNGRDLYVGRWGCPEARVEYERVIAEWLTRRRCFPDTPRSDALTVNEVLLGYLHFAKRHYRKNELRAPYHTTLSRQCRTLDVPLCRHA